MDSSRIDLEDLYQAYAHVKTFTTDVADAIKFWLMGFCANYGIDAFIILIRILKSQTMSMALHVTHFVSLIMFLVGFSGQT